MNATSNTAFLDLFEEAIAKAAAAPPPPPPEERPKTARALVAQVIEAAQDFEFYPTTNEIIRALVRDIKARDRFSSILDVGAGNGKVLLAIDEQTNINDLYAIEKSTILCQQLPAKVLIVGTEFAEQSLISKNVDVVFSNPPYREFETWAEKIIRQASAAAVYLVIPERWERSQRIADALTFREAKAVRVGAFDFENSEDRQARAKVHLLRVDLHRERYKDDNDDAFNRFFKEQFADLIGKFETAGVDKDAEDVARKSRPFDTLVVGPSYPAALVEIYNRELANVENNYALVSQLDADLLREFNISPDAIMGCLKLRLKGLRSDYWNELFNRLNTVTDRLCSASRKQLLETLQRHLSVDFTVSNICAVVIWVIKNANDYIDSQLLSVYSEMIAKCNVVLYKSNKRTFQEDRWRYNGDADHPNSHYALDYRIVTHRVGGISQQYSWDHSVYLDERAAAFIGDLLTIARNLGFNCTTGDSRIWARYQHGAHQWQPGKTECFYFTNADGRREMIFDVKAFKNGNLHLRLNQRFILALNVEHGRLKGWLRNASEAVAELGEAAAADYFKSNIQLCPGDTLMLTGGTQ